MRKFSASCQSVLLASGLLVLPALALAQQPPATVVATASTPGVRAKAAEVVLHAKVVELDQANRVAVLRNSKGQLLTVDVPASITNFDQVRVGDELAIRYAAAVAMELEPVAKETGIREKVESSTNSTATVGGLPSASSGRKIQALAVVEAIDRKARTVKLRGVKRSFIVSAPDNVDLAKIKVGQEVRAVFVEAAAVSVEQRARK